MLWRLVPLLLILYGEDKYADEAEGYGVSRYSAKSGGNRSGGGRYGVDALLGGVDADLNRYAALLDGESVYWDSAQEYEKSHTYAENVTGNYGFFDLSGLEQTIEAYSYRCSTE